MKKVKPAKPDGRKNNKGIKKPEGEKKVSLGLYGMQKNKAMLREKLLVIIKKLDK
jgi:hypothetical protein